MPDKRHSALFAASCLKHSLAECLARDVDIISRRCAEDDSMFSRQARKEVVAV